MNVRRFFMLLPTCVFACANVVIDDREGDALAGRSQAEDDGAGETDGPPQAPSLAEESWMPHEGAQCVNDCASWIAGCENDSICVEPAATCPGLGAEHVRNLIACVCAGCSKSCGGSCVMFDDADSECLACQQTMVAQTCNYEYYACTGA